MELESKDKSNSIISFVVPAFNEAGSISLVCAQILGAFPNATFEIILVDDGSTDGTWTAIEALAQTDSRICGIQFRTNFGKAAALSAGFREAIGDRIVTLDADLQDDPAEVTKLLAILAQGHDVVVGWKRFRKDPLNKVIPSRCFNWLIGRISGVKLHDHNCGLKVLRRQVVQELSLYGELHRFITLMAASKGFSIVEVEINHRERLYGKSKYGTSRYVKGLLDLMTVSFLNSYGRRPLHFLGTIGLLGFIGGAIGLLYLAALWVLGFRPMGTRPVLAYSGFSLLLGAQMLSVGILAELITWRLSSTVGSIEPYLISRVTRQRQRQNIN